MVLGRHEDIEIYGVVAGRDTIIWRVESIRTTLERLHLNVPLGQCPHEPKGQRGFTASRRSGGY